ncbi:MAG: DUF814 domain-containing protein [Bacteroidetes bacterium]|nr:DUF814 domain-containing protein [Fibrella sp.]
MHTNFYFLRQLAPALDLNLTGLRFMECYSQDRDELVLVFAQARGKNNYYKPFYIKATLRPDFSGLLFPESVQRARTNSVELFEQVTGRSDGRTPDVSGEEGPGRPVIRVQSFLNERCLAISLEDGFTLLFKFFGNRPNFLVFQENTIIDLFNHKLAGDYNLTLNTIDRPIDQSRAAFDQAGYDHKKLFPTFGKVVNSYLTEQGIKDKSPDEKWELLRQTVRQLETPQYYLTRFEHKPTLSLVPIGADDPHQREFSEPIEATNRFFINFNGLNTFEREKGEVLRLLEKRLKRAENLIEANLQRLIAREEGASHEEMGHILMANLHEVRERTDHVTLTDFYRDQPITIKLKPDLSPQKNAENYYRKSKNEKIEAEHLQGQIDARAAEMDQTRQHRTAIDAMESLKVLRKYVKLHGLLTDRSDGALSDDPTQAFKQVDFQGYRILIGRNAKNNDLLTQRFTYKDDLWMHARDVAGSHVVVKYQAGKTFPKTVIERAAELAAWYSKRRTDSLCPVIVTPKKYVRKPKGLAEGQVVVEKEEVVMVVPRGED